VLAATACYQPISRSELSDFLGRVVSRDLIGRLRSFDLIAAGPRSPQPDAPYTFVTTKRFLGQFGLDTLRDLPNLEEAGLLSKDQPSLGQFSEGFGVLDGDTRHARDTEHVERLSKNCVAPNEKVLRRSPKQAAASSAIALASSPRRRRMALATYSSMHLWSLGRCRGPAASGSRTSIQETAPKFPKPILQVDIPPKRTSDCR